MVRTSDLRTREVINILDGKRLGAVDDVEIDLEAGRITAVVIPGSGRLLGLFGKSDEVVIPWDKIKRIGVDTILVEFEGLPAEPPLRRGGRNSL
ncbi:MAG: YlmC/YmxH family sporulation protein [bacterium]|jgi:YlmC/YmxH family sporulation protein